MPLLYVALIEGRTPEEIRSLLDAMHDAVVARCDAADLIVSITDNGDEDWSFGHGRAQFLTGELK
jgi:Tautomerase enzyme